MLLYWGEDNWASSLQHAGHLALLSEGHGGAVDCKPMGTGWLVLSAGGHLSFCNTSSVTSLVPHLHGMAGMWGCGAECLEADSGWLCPCPFLWLFFVISIQIKIYPIQTIFWKAILNIWLKSLPILHLFSGNMSFKRLPTIPILTANTTHSSVVHVTRAACLGGLFYNVLWKTDFILCKCYQEAS
mgnify:CR=1 FL=1